MNTYRCSECRRPIGLMVDKNGKPELFMCPHTGQVASALVKGRYE